jgi:transposase
MLGHHDKQQELFVTGTWQDLVPSDYILRKVDKVLDLSWLREEVADLYSSDRGRPSIDPEAAVRLMLAGFFHGIVHDRALLREAQMHMGIRWFAGYGLSDSLPHHSSLTRLRQRWGAERFRRIFERTVQACAEAGLVDLQTVHVDATLIRADVSWESLAREHSSKVWSEHEEGQPGQAGSSGDPRSGGAGKGAKRSRGTKGKLRSSTDPDAALATSHPKWPAQPSYKQHTAVDSHSGVVLDAEVTTGDCHEGSQLIEQIDRVERCTGQEVQRVTTDAGYSSGKNFEQLESREIEAVIPASEPYRLAKIPAQRFRYDAHHDWVRCPRKKLLRRGSRNRKNTGWIYRARSQDCQACPLRFDCFSPTSRRRVILIVDGYPALLRARRHKGNWSQEWKQAQKRHRWQVEGRHGEAKKHHGLGRAVRRGLDNVRIQAYLTAAVMNLKRLAAAAASFLDFWQLLEALLTSLGPRQLKRAPRLSICHA